MSVKKRAWWDACNFPEMPSMTPSNDQTNLFNNYVSIPVEQQSSEENGRLLKFTVRVPKRVVSGRTPAGECGFMISLTGGGLTTQNPEFPAWQKVHHRPILATEPIIVAPSYLLMPEHSSSEMNTYMEHAWTWIFEGGFQRWLDGKFPHMRGHVNFEKFLLEAQSAGCHWAFHLWGTRKDVEIAVMYLQYPMVDGYARTYDQEYRGRRFDQTYLHDIALQNLEDVARWRLKNPNQQQIGRTPPAGMGNLPYTATRTEVLIAGRTVVVSLWWLLFRGPSMKDHLEYWKTGSFPPIRDQPLTLAVLILPARIRAAVKDNLEFLGCKWNDKLNALECEVEYTSIPKPDYVPRVFSNHGREDVNCPVTDTIECKSSLQQLYPGGLVRDEDNIVVEDETHGYDEYMGSAEQMAEIVSHLGWNPVVS